MKDKFIDLEKLISDKNPKLLKRIPGFIIRYLKRVIHEDDVNSFLKDSRNLFNRDFCSKVINDFNITLNVKGVENIPLKGGAIFTVNHPLGGMDAMAIVHAFSDIRPDIKFIVNDLLLNLKNLNGLFVGVNKHGKNSSESLQQVNDLFKSDNAVFVFPAGLVSRKIKGIVKDLKWKKTFITQAKKYEKPVIPVYLDGELSNFFYRLSNLRRALGIKANIEMLYLVDEQYNQHDKVINITVGKPIPPSTFDNTKSDLEWAQSVKEDVYNLK